MRLLEKILETHGGRKRWEKARTIEAVISTGGLAFNARFRGEIRNLRAELQVHRPEVTLDCPDRGWKAQIQDTNITIESTSESPESQKIAAKSFHIDENLGWIWGDLEQAYFTGMVLWNYLTMPALLTKFLASETDSSVTLLLPEEIPSHCRKQFLTFDEEGLLRRHEYIATAFGGWARAAHDILDYDTFNGILMPSYREVYPFALRRTGLAFPRLVWIRMHDFQLK